MVWRSLIMNCKAIIHDEFGGKYKCLEEATVKVTIKTFAPHVQKVLTKSTCLCNHHKQRYLSRHRYQIKHLGKQTEIIEEML